MKHLLLPLLFLVGCASPLARADRALSRSVVGIQEAYATYESAVSSIRAYCELELNPKQCRVQWNADDDHVKLVRLFYGQMLLQYAATSDMVNGLQSTGRTFDRLVTEAIEDSEYLRREFGPLN